MAEAKDANIKVVALNNLAMLLVQGGETEKAEASVRDAIALAENANLIDTLAIVLEAQGNKQQAIDLLNLKIKEYAADVNLRVRLARLLMDADQLDAASEVMKAISSMATSESVDYATWKQIRELRLRQSAMEEEAEASREAESSAESNAAAPVVE